MRTRGPSLRLTPASSSKAHAAVACPVSARSRWHGHRSPHRRMTQLTQLQEGRRLTRLRTASSAWRAFGLGTALAEILIIGATSVACGIGYHLIVHDSYGELVNFVALGGVVALIFLSANAFIGDYALPLYIAPTSRIRRPLASWNIAFLYTLAISVMAKSGAELSRGNVILLYFAGIGAIMLWRWLVIRLVVRARTTGQVGARRGSLVGEPAAGAGLQHRPVLPAPRAARRRARRDRGFCAPLPALESRLRDRRPGGAAIEGQPRARSRSRRAHRPRAPPRRRLRDPALVRHGDDRARRRQAHDPAGLDPSRPRAHPRPFRQGADHQGLGHGDALPRAPAAHVPRGRREAPVRHRRRGSRPRAAAAILSPHRGPDPPRQPRAGGVPPAALRLQPEAVLDLQIPHHAGPRRPPGPPGDPRRRARDADRRPAAALEHRRAAAAAERAHRRHVARRPAAARGAAHPGLRAAHRALCPPPQRQAGHHRLGAGQRARS